ncbi:ThuA domain-containing protein [Sphingobacterium sp. Mn56C]|uniref:ThuA domain-containing protein n=1 Tax=Sphingobacterium sp. Mn56C TaxID=3395261 RepID=UPI003BBFBD1B
MKKIILCICLLCLTAMQLYAQGRFPRFKVLAFYNEHVEPAHVEFAEEAIVFFKKLTEGNGFVFDVTKDLNDLNDEKLKDYALVMLLNDVPGSPQQRQAFEKYMQNGGGWFGFHVAAYNDARTNWPWFVDFLGAGVFYRNNWPPLPATVVIDKPEHPVVKGLPQRFVAPLNEWYQWKPSPRAHKNIQVLATLAPENYPLGLKDIIPDGDTPIVWTNTAYRMIYLNMGHGRGIFSDATQNKLIIDAFKWVIATDKKGNVFER